MSNSTIALGQLKLRKLPYWKLYKGNSKVSQCDKDENPSANTDEASRQFEEELKTRINAPGSYYVNVYRNINGEKGGFKYEFQITGNETIQSTNTSPQMTQDEFYTKVRRDIEIEMSLKRIETKIDAIGDFILSKTTETDKDDNEALKLITGIFGQAMKAKATAAPAVASNGFASLTR